MKPREHALKVAVLSTLLDAVKAEYARARAEAGETFAEVRKDGQTQQKVLMPDGTEIGLISIRGGTPSIALEPPDALEAWCHEHARHAFEQYVVEHAVEMQEVISLIAAHYPNLVRTRIRASSLAAFMKQLGETGGYLANDDGEKAKLATVGQGGPTGAFSYRPARGAQDRIVAEWMAGNLREVALGPLALPAAGGDGT